MQTEKQLETVEQSHRIRLKELQEQLNEKESKLAVKEKYIEQLLEQNDEFKSNLERIAFETFVQLKNELFDSEQKLDVLAMRKQFVPVLDEIEQEVAAMMEKYH